MFFLTVLCTCLWFQHDITGRALLRITDSSLQRMGIESRDREVIWREIVKQRLKTDIMEIRDMERIVVNRQSSNKLPPHANYGLK